MGRKNVKTRTLLILKAMDFPFLIKFQKNLLLFSAVVLFMANPKKSFVLGSPLGLVNIEGDSDGVSAIGFAEEGLKKTDINSIPEELKVVGTQLTEYFEKKRETFDFALNIKGTEFQSTVWAELRRIPYGTTISYKQLAERIGKPKAYRAVANANGKNPLLIVNPCHRVIGSDDSLAGFSCGIHHKKWLLQHENPSSPF